MSLVLFTHRLNRSCINFKATSIDGTNKTFDWRSINEWESIGRRRIEPNLICGVAVIVNSVVSAWRMANGVCRVAPDLFSDNYLYRAPERAEIEH